MKRVFAIICACALMAALVSCSASAPMKSPDTTPTESPAADETTAPMISAEPTPAVTSDPEPTPGVTSDPEPTQAPDQSATTGADEYDVDSAIDASTTTETTPAAIGQWVKTARYATEDKAYHTIYVRVTKITTQTADDAYVQAAIDLNNQNGADYKQIDIEKLKLPADVELCVLDYDVNVPADFPGPDYGIVEPSMDFSQSNVGGGGIPSADGASVYIGLGSNTMDIIQEANPTYQPGNMYSFKCIYTMVKGYTDYVLNFISYPDGTKETSTDIMYHGYFAVK